jgi:uncharacterized protein (DUF952 family)
MGVLLGVAGISVYRLGGIRPIWLTWCCGLDILGPADRFAYKVMLVAETEQMLLDGLFRGSPADIADGYIHLSSRPQLVATLDRYFSGVSGLMLAAVDLSRLGDALRWEPSRGGQLFPHIHGVLPVDAVVSVGPLERSPDGAVKLPA